MPSIKRLNSPFELLATAVPVAQSARFASANQGQIVRRDPPQTVGPETHFLMGLEQGLFGPLTGTPAASEERRGCGLSRRPRK